VAAPTHPVQEAAARVGSMAATLVGSEILQIAAEIRALVKSGRAICNLTVGDFDPRQFPTPQRLRDEIAAALARGETNYPPSEGLPDLRAAVQRFYARELGLDVPLESVLIGSGARPLLYGAYRTLLDPGERLVYPVPSWNNNHYAHLAGAVGVPIVCDASTRFLPTEEALRGELARARVVALNSPLNPSGTAIEPAVLRGISRAILAENEERESRGDRPLFLVYDQVYWRLVVEGTEHATPSALEPAIARYTVYVDGISKAFAATGLRVGWAVGPSDVIERMSAVIGHVGAWAPRAEQAATARWLDDSAAMSEFHAGFRAGISARLAALHEGLQRMKRRGLPVDSLEPMGAIYLTARIDPFGRRTRQGTKLATSEEIRRYVLDEAGIGIVPFRAFGVATDEGWFRLSIGAVSLAEIQAALPRLETALAALRA
jgi:aspartate aminotransferase